ncbi:hypothetical protein JD844_010559 [Phrynosoma platyrhinos]|uniref:Uncharacterized protein n=1 Tax=Phrynosoma platyrhinos TaxID=52577 RepID=A0ABQ7TGQ5_PHRPL|nr:hypothetical protein JD844_010559 [Phrynosoma platyrhinos]
MSENSHEIGKLGPKISSPLLPFQYLFQNVSKGLGQLEAYINAEEGVAFQMDNNLFWDSLGRGYDWAIQGLFEKMESGKFLITRLSSGKVMLRDWIGMYLAAMDVGTDPNTFPILPVQYSEDASLQFDVFYRENKVAFRAYNGLFLSRMYRGFYTIEAAKYLPDDACYFRPLIGDLLPPTFEILRMDTDDSKVRCHHHVLEKQTYVNWSEVPEQHTFSMKWETHCTDKIIWDRLWGLGSPFSCRFTVAGVTPTVRYTENNDKSISLSRYIYERRREEVEVPPKTKALVSLCVSWHNTAFVPFTLVIKKVKSNGTMVILHESGVWKGLAYCNVHMKVKLEKLGESCVAM